LVPNSLVLYLTKKRVAPHRIDHNGTRSKSNLDVAVGELKVEERTVQYIYGSTHC